MSLRTSTPKWFQTSSRSFSLHNQQKANLTTEQSPIRKLAEASKGCNQIRKVYAECIFKAQFSNEGTGVEKGICEKEFLAFKDCVQKKIGRKW